MPGQSSTQKHEVSIATANTHFGDVTRVEGGLAPLSQDSPDVLLLQEAVDPTVDLESQLARANYKLVHHAGELGLAMALRADSRLSLVPESVRTHELHKMGYVERTLAQRWAKRPHNMKSHGMLEAKFTDESGHELTTVNMRVTVPGKRFARTRTIRRAGRKLNSDPYYSGDLVLGGDMNHFSGPRKSDVRMHKRAGLKQIDLNHEPTWHARHSRAYRTLAKIRLRPVEHYDAQPDVLLHRGEGLEPVAASVVDINSDHRAIIGKYKLRQK